MCTPLVTLVSLFLPSIFLPWRNHWVLGLCSNHRNSWMQLKKTIWIFTLFLRILRPGDWAPFTIKMISHGWLGQVPPPTLQYICSFPHRNTCHKWPHNTSSKHCLVPRPLGFLPWGLSASWNNDWRQQGLFWLHTWHRSSILKRNKCSLKRKRSLARSQRSSPNYPRSVRVSVKAAQVSVETRNEIKFPHQVFKLLWNVYAVRIVYAKLVNFLYFEVNLVDDQIVSLLEQILFMVFFWFSDQDLTPPPQFP